MKKTPWYPADAKPVRVGVYEKEFDSDTNYQYWDGLKWWYGFCTIEETAETFFNNPPLGTPLPRRWRGVTKP